MTTAAPTFVGSEECAVCHTGEYAAWQNSHHALAMLPATDATVLGDFDDASFDYFGRRSEFSTSAGEFLVRTEGSDGEPSDFRVTHTFGVDPLQQYLVEFPNGRLQALPFAWDTRPAAEGGQRWFHLYPDEDIRPDDPLHWTGRYFNWNFMCAECHSTNLVSSYDIATDAFTTTMSEVFVGCEGCHGPASQHAAQARTGEFDADHGLAVDLDDRGAAAWIMNMESGIATLSAAGAQQQPEACGRCHARRSVLTPRYEYGRPLTDTHLPSLLEQHLYHADGRILDEVYVYGSFLQSRMYAAGVTCSDCHDPHSAELHTGPDPNDVCAQCHLPARFATAEHSGTESTDCVACHMQSRTYMQVDPRRDHSFRLPGTVDDPDHYGTAIAAGHDGGANAVLIDAIARDDYPAIARATMLTLLSAPGPDEIDTVLSNLDAADPLLRIAALRALRNFPVEMWAGPGSALLRDPNRGVRIEAAQTYVDLRDLLPAEDARAFPAAAEEYRASLLAAANMPESLTMLAEFEARMRQDSAAIRYLEHAIRLDPSFAPARHSYGLRLVVRQDYDGALRELRRAVELDPDNPRYVYVYAIGLNSTGDADAALAVLEQAHRDFVADFDIAFARVTILRDRGDLDAARAAAREMLREWPNDPNVFELLRSLGE